MEKSKCLLYLGPSNEVSRDKDRVEGVLEGTETVEKKDEGGRPEETERGGFWVVGRMWPNI